MVTLNQQDHGNNAPYFLQSQRPHSAFGGRSLSKQLNNALSFGTRRAQCQAGQYRSRPRPSSSRSVIRQRETRPASRSERRRWSGGINCHNPLRWRRYGLSSFVAVRPPLSRLLPLESANGEQDQHPARQRQHQDDRYTNRPRQPMIPLPDRRMVD